jgi:TPR repeat protein
LGRRKALHEHLGRICEGAIMTRHRHVRPSVEGDARFCALHKEAEEGQPLAQLTLARSYREGNGAPQNAAAALYWYRRVAKLEPSYVSGIAALAIGEMYRTGEGVPRNYKRALINFHIAVTQGSSRAETHIGDMHRFGEGVPRDYQEALKWYRKAAKASDVGACERLGEMCSNGRGVRRDYARAYAWFSVVAGHFTAKADQKERALKQCVFITELLTDTQYAHATKLADNWLAKHDL